MKIYRNEYPRPELVREKWISLNGEWDFENRTVTQDITLYASWAGRGF